MDSLYPRSEHGRWRTHASQAGPRIGVADAEANIPDLALSRLRCPSSLAVSP